MSSERRLQVVDVFGSGGLSGNPVAVLHDAEGLADEELQAFARWTNLSETTFLLPPTDPRADYRVRIFTIDEELPFAGHPTLGTAHAWLAGREDRDALVQECAAGLVELRRTDGRWAFAGPPLTRSGPLTEEELETIAAELALPREALLDGVWADNGPGWSAVLLRDAAAVLAVGASGVRRPLGVVGPHPPGGEAAIEVRGFFPSGDLCFEDPVTGSLNAAIAPWLALRGVVGSSYVAAQGTAVHRRGRVHVTVEDDGRVWVAGETRTVVDGTASV